MNLRLPLLIALALLTFGVAYVINAPLGIASDGKDRSADPELSQKTAVKDKAKWKQKLDPMAYKVACQGGTEPPFTGKYWDFKGQGIYTDALTGVPLFASTTKFKSGTGWPSFFNVISEDNVIFKQDRSHGMVRTEVISASSGAHLGHVFQDGPPPTGIRYCINSAALQFVPGPTTVDDPSLPLLQAKLRHKQEQFQKNADADTRRVYEQGIETLARNQVGAAAPAVGEPAPNFTLPAASGKQVELAKLLKQGPVVLMWYRGGWCPYCNIQLRTYQQVLPRFEKLGAQLVAISPELPDKSLSTRQKNELAFHVLSDVGNQVAAKYDIAYTLPQPVQDKFQGKLDLAAFNGDESATLPLSATFVIAPDGTVAYRFIDADYRKRAEIADVIAAIRKISDRDHAEGAHDKTAGR